MSNQELSDMISAVQNQNRSLLSLISDQKREQNSKRSEIDSLEKQLNRCIRLPYLVATISEVSTFYYLVYFQVLRVPVEDEDNLAKPEEKQEMEDGVIMSTIMRKVFLSFL